MSYQDLKKFITEDMRMSQVYQPVMLMQLLKNNGEATVQQIAQAILDKDPTQIEYFSEIVKNMVGRVLTKNRGITEKDGIHIDSLGRRTSRKSRSMNWSLCVSRGFKTLSSSVVVQSGSTANVGIDQSQVQFVMKF